MTTAVHDRKLTRRFELLDANGDGYLERADYETLARKLVRGFAESPTSPKGKAVIDTYVQYWENFVSRMDSDGDGKVTKDEFIDAIGRKIINADEFDRIARPHFHAVAVLADTNDDGELDRDEYVRLMAMYGVDRRDALDAFEQIDANHDNLLSVEELTAAARDFYLSDNDNSSGSAMFGRH